MERVPITSPSFFIGKGQGDGFISFGSGQPDLPPPPGVYDILPDYDDFKYGLIQGQENLRAALAKEYPRGQADSFVITNGASEALDLSLRALYEPGARVAIPRPYYYSYPHNVELAKMEVRYYDLERGKINLDTFKEVVQHCKVVIINSPANPTGSAQDMETLKEIERFCDEKGIWILSDEVYKDLIYERENYLIEGERVVTINSFSKTYSMCGFRVGYLYARDPEFLQKVIEMKTHSSMCTNILGQEMAYAATKTTKAFLDEQLDIWRERRELFYNGLVDLGLDVWKPEGAFYLFPKFHGLNPTDVIHDLYYDYNLIAYDGHWFGDPTRVRFSYALDKDKIVEGLSRLKQYLAK